jgi:hypothetical protein
MTHRLAGRFALTFLVASACVGVLAVAFVGPGRAEDGPNERTIKPQINVQDAATKKLWVLDFKFKDPRLITVDIPGRGKKVCWYLWYQVINHTGEPRTFIPDFELVTHDFKTVHRDQVLPTVEEAIRKVEDPTGYYKIKNSVTIAAEPIPPSKEEALPRPVTGVAIWDDVNPKTNYFSIFVAGLSNGWALTDPIPPATKPIVRRKTLQLNFKRPGDEFFPKSSEIRFVAPARWIYRGSELSVPGLAEFDKKAGMK